MGKIDQPENSASPESQEKESKIVLHFLRHGEKESGVVGDDTMPRLTSTGRAQSIEHSSPGTDLKQSLAFGSERVRSRETAQLAMAGSEDGITGDETFYELAAKLKKGSGKTYGEKVLIDPRLNFTLNEKTPLGEAMVKAFYAKSYLKFLVEESDAMAKSLNDTVNSTYSTQAATIAEIIKKYTNISDQWQRLVNDDSKQYSEKMERFLGTHQGVPESFLAKVIEKIKGVKERDVFVAVLNGQGFGFAENFDVEVVKKNSAEAPIVRVKYVKADKAGKEIFAFDEVVSSEIIEEIIKEGKRTE